MKNTSRTDSAVGMGCLFFLLLIVSPLWLVIILGLGAPFWIAGLIVLAVVAAVRGLFKK